MLLQRTVHRRNVQRRFAVLVVREVDGHAFAKQLADEWLVALHRSRLQPVMRVCWHKVWVLLVVLMPGVVLARFLGAVSVVRMTAMHVGALLLLRR